MNLDRFYRTVAVSTVSLSLSSSVYLHLRRSYSNPAGLSKRTDNTHSFGSCLSLLLITLPLPRYQYYLDAHGDESLLSRSLLFDRFAYSFIVFYKLYSFISLSSIVKLLSILEKTIIFLVTQRCLIYF